MEKIMYSLWRPEGEPAIGFRDQLLNKAAPELLRCGAHRVRVCVVDEAVEAAAPLRMIVQPPAVAAVVSIWVDSATRHAEYETVFAGIAPGFAAHVVSESEPIRAAPYWPADGERVAGMCQIVYLQKPPRLERDEWLRIWLDSHTGIAIDTQSTFGYRQNLVVRALRPGPLRFDAIVEENFPAEAMTSQHAFYAATGDDAKLTRNRDTMIASCMRFIDFDRIDVVPTSEYNWSTTQRS